MSVRIKCAHFVIKMEDTEGVGFFFSGLVGSQSTCVFVIQNLILGDCGAVNHFYSILMKILVFDGDIKAFSAYLHWGGKQTRYIFQSRTHKIVGSLRTLSKMKLSLSTNILTEKQSLPVLAISGPFKRGNLTSDGEGLWRPHAAASKLIKNQDAHRFR